MGKNIKPFFVFAPLLIFIVAGLLLASKIETTTFCTLMWCQPENGIGRQRIPCNNCSLSEMLFFTGFFNLVRECPAREWLVFEDGEQIDTQYEINKTNCQMTFNHWRWR